MNVEIAKKLTPEEFQLIVSDAHQARLREAKYRLNKEIEEIDNRLPNIELYTHCPKEERTESYLNGMKDALTSFKEHIKVSISNIDKDTND